MLPAMFGIGHLLFSLTHILTVTCTRCYDEIKGTQDRKIYSHADSQILSYAASQHHSESRIYMSLLVQNWWCK